MNGKNNFSNNPQSVWLWVGIGIVTLVVLITVNGPILINNLLPEQPTAQAQRSNQFVDQAQPIQIATEEIFEEEVFYDYEHINDYIDQDLSSYDFDGEMLKGSTELYLTATFSRARNIYWDWGWCTSDEDTLLENFEHITLNVTLNDFNMNELLIQSDYDSFGSTCRTIEFSTFDWEPGIYTLKAEIIFTEEIDDGLGDAHYPAATHLREYQITVTE